MGPLDPKTFISFNQLQNVVIVSNKKIITIYCRHPQTHVCTRTIYISFFINHTKWQYNPFSGFGEAEVTVKRDYAF